MYFFTLIVSLFCILPHGLKGEESGRLLMCVDAHAAFTATELAERTSATYIKVDQRNPYKALLPVCLNHPLVCIDCIDPNPKIKTIRRLAHRCGYRYVHFINESLDEAVAKAESLLQSIPRYSSEIYHMSDEDSKRLYSLLDKIDHLFTAHGITYWAGRGTLLGAVRHGGIMPWEDYHSLHILDTDLEKLKNLTEALDEEGLVLHAYWKGFYKIFEKDGDVINDPENPGELLPFRYPVADLFAMSLECRHEIDDVYVHQSWNCYWHWTDEKFSYSQIAGIKRVPFGPLHIPIPENPEEVLDKLYGTPQYPELWKKYAIEPFWDHKKEKARLWTGNALVEIDDFSPAH